MEFYTVDHAAFKCTLGIPGVLHRNSWCLNDLTGTKFQWE